MIIAAAVLAVAASPLPAERGNLVSSAACTPSWAELKFDGEADSSRDFSPSRPGTNTHIWSCRVGGRLLVVKHNAGVPQTFGCSATILGVVSAWVDGLKVLDRAMTGDAVGCRFSGEPALTRVRLDQKGQFRSCQFVDHGAGLREAETCRGQNLLAGRRKVDPAYVKPGVRTPPGLILRHAAGPVCRTATAQLRLDPGHNSRDSSFAAQAVTQFPRSSTVKSPDGDYGEARLDIDNDGKIDEVRVGSVIRRHGGEWGHVQWRQLNGRWFTAPDLPRTRAGVASLPALDDEVTFDKLAVRLEGRTYLYMRRRTVMEWGLADYEAVFGATPGGADQITRGLVELHPDGTSRLVCGWGPKLRPEEFL